MYLMSAYLLSCRYHECNEVVMVLTSPPITLHRSQSSACQCSNLYADLFEGAWNNSLRKGFLRWNMSTRNERLAEVNEFWIGNPVQRKSGRSSEMDKLLFKILLVIIRPGFLSIFYA